jgi:hypothetical protein
MCLSADTSNDLVSWPVVLARNRFNSTLSFIISTSGGDGSNFDVASGSGNMDPSTIIIKLSGGGVSNTAGSVCSARVGTLCPAPSGLLPPWVLMSVVNQHRKHNYGYVHPY